MSKPVLFREVITDSVKRICRICKEEKQLNKDFHFHSGSECYSNTCKNCHNLRRRIVYKGEELPDVFKVPFREPKKKRLPSKNKPYRKTTYANRKRLNYKAFDKVRNLDHDLTLEFLEESLSLPCTYCGFPSTGLDRVDNSKGHTMGNSVPCCYECNSARLDNFSHEEMKLIGEAIREVKLARDKE